MKNEVRKHLEFTLTLPPDDVELLDSIVANDPMRPSQQQVLWRALKIGLASIGRESSAIGGTNPWEKGGVRYLEKLQALLTTGRLWDRQELCWVYFSGEHVHEGDATFWLAKNGEPRCDIAHPRFVPAPFSGEVS